MKSYAIIGTGAIGGYCAVKLYQAGFEVHCLLRSDYDYVKQHGLTIKTANEIINASVKSYQQSQDMPQFDVVLVALKTTANTLLKELLPKLIHPNTVVVVLQNGIGIEKEIANFIDAERIIGGSCMLKVSKDSPGIIKHFGLNSIELAILPRRHSNRYH